MGKRKKRLMLVPYALPTLPWWKKWKEFIVVAVLFAAVLVYLNWGEIETMVAMAKKSIGTQKYP